MDYQSVADSMVQGWVVSFMVGGLCGGVLFGPVVLNAWDRYLEWRDQREWARAAEADEAWRRL